MARDTVVTTEPSGPTAPRPASRFGAFAYRDFRLLWTGLVVSNTGSWMQYLAQGWLVVELASGPAQQSFYLGMVGLVRAVPVLLLSGVAGALADRMERRRILAFAQVVMGTSALILGVLVAFHVARIWEVMLLAAMTSAGSAFDAPTRQSMVPLIVGKAELMNAIGLNSAAFNGPAIVGPAIAGIVVAAVGIAPCFFLNALSYVAVLIAVAMMSPKPPVTGLQRPGIWHEMLAGVQYVRANTPVLGLVSLATVVALVARPYIQLLPAFAKGVIGGGPATLGALGSAAGAGALAGSIAVAFLGIQRRRGAIVLSCAAASGIVLTAFGFTRSSWAASITLVALGAVIMLFMGISNTLLQTYSELEMRGRVMALYTMTFLGLMPLGTWLLGSIAALISLPATLEAAGLVIVAASVTVAVRMAPLRELH